MEEELPEERSDAIDIEWAATNVRRPEDAIAVLSESNAKLKVELKEVHRELDDYKNACTNIGKYVLEANANGRHYETSQKIAKELVRLFND